ncbi:glycosyltransferase family 4 protein [Methylocystis sp. FS]|uniref:glycosyltransferase family 4 protein n=1 Tax=Methylocystis silviterrae TaxID=2743612 RepID=UPI001581C7A8|nr:glycosyltransferase family 4 protein [Methylocystis silviterrae]NUJ81650.1 glycosyltransferase family 4 protein [Methylocystis silviterrae]
MLATDAHGGFGGIAQYNRDVIDALSGLPSVAEITVVPRIISSPEFASPPKTRYVRSASGVLLKFIFCSLREGLFRGSYDLVYCAHLNLLPLAASITKIRRRPLVLAIYGIDAWSKPPSALTRAALACVDVVISISQLTLDRFKSWAKPLRAELAIVPNAIRAADYGMGNKAEDLLARYRLAGRRVIMTLGRMDPNERAKGFDEIIELLPRLAEREPAIVYLCAGDGGDRMRLEAKAQSLGVADRVVFTGRFSESRKADHFRLSDAYIMPSRWEGFGFVVVEALACGIPVVASTKDGTREAVRNGELGLLVDPKDADSLERAILDALSRPKAIPPGLDYFSFANFEKRLAAALSNVAPGLV